MAQIRRDGTGGINFCGGINFGGGNWRVVQRPIVTEDGIPISGFKANLRETDDKVLGVVTDRCRVVQNNEAFAFTDSLLGKE